MTPGCIVLAAILLAIAAFAVRSFPSFLMQWRIGAHLAERGSAQPYTTARKSRARVIEFPLRRVTGS